MRKPEDFTRSLDEAEGACVAFLAEALCMRPGVDLFRSVNPGVADGGVFDIGYPQTGDLNTFRAPVYHFRAQLDLVSRDRRLLQARLMAILAALPVSSRHAPGSPLRADTNVETLRVAPEAGAVGEITTAKIAVEEGRREIPVFTSSVRFDVVFLAGDRAE